jgi:signal transduction histidine kinase
MFNISELAKLPGLDKSEEVQQLLRDSSHLVALTNDVLDLSKMEEIIESNTEPKLVKTNVFAFKDHVSGLIDGVKARERFAGSLIPEISIEIDYYMPEVIMMDQARCAQVILNFVSNAIKYSGTCGDVKVLIRAVDYQPEGIVSYGSMKSAPKYLLFQVCDCGNEVQNTTSLFNSFASGTMSQKQASGARSLGVGLAICRLNALYLKGIVGYGSRKQDRGNEFYLALPLEECDDDVDDSESGDASDYELVEQGFNPNMYKILCVDDNSMNLMIVSRMLRDLSYQFDVVNTAEEALFKIKKSPKYDIMLLGKMKKTHSLISF